MGEKQRLVKVTLSSGKIVFLREMKIGDTEKAAQKVSRQAGGDPLLMNVMIKRAMLANLLVKIAENAEATPRDLSGNEKEDMDGLFKIAEYAQLMGVLQKMSGDDESGEEATVTFLEG